MKPLSDLLADWPLVDRLLDEALALPPHERVAWLDALDERHAPISSTLRRLLMADGAIETGGFMATLPKLGAGPAAGGGGDAGGPATNDTVGPWRLLRELGQGGMGSVWLAERVDGHLKRQVALKLPRLSWARGLAERMARERDILALLEHPHIARLYDASVDAAGRPWLALELVHGRPIDVHARDNGLDVRQRLQLLLQVCDAVAFAHARLVIHRDLKPGNVLVTDAGQVKLLDFGIAKLLQDDAAATTALTEIAGRALTLDYASPEQVQGRPLTTASDVYSLGVLAYELLAGVRPYRLKRGSAAELEEAIAVADVPLASNRAPPDRRQALRGDIDAILNKALKKDPQSRYGSVGDFAADLQRHLHNQPVTAQPDAPAYLARKFLRRHRLPVAAAASVALALLVGAALALAQARRADTERALAVAANQAARAAQTEAERQAQEALHQSGLAKVATARAEQQGSAANAAANQARLAADRAAAAAAAERRAAAQARLQGERAAAVQQFVVGLFNANTARQADPQKARGTTARELLDIGAARLQAAGLAGQHDARREVALVLSRLYEELGLHPRSLELAQLALDLSLQHWPAGSPQHAGALAQVLEQTRVAGRAEEVKALGRQAESVLSQMQRQPSLERIELLRKLATLYEFDDASKAQRLAAEAGALARRLGDAQALQAALTIQARAVNRMGNVAQAEELLTQALALSQRSGADSAHDLALLRAALADAQTRQLRVAEAVATLRQALDNAVRAAGADHIDANQLRLRLATPLMFLGATAEARSLLEQVRDSFRTQGSAAELTLSLTLGDLGVVQLESGRLEDAEVSLGEALAMRDRLRPNSDTAAVLRENLAGLRLQQGQLAEADRLLNEAERIRSGLGQRPGQIAWDRLVFRRIEVARVRKQPQEAQRLATQLHSGSPADTLRTTLWLRGLLLRASVELDLGSNATAAQHLQQVEQTLAPHRNRAPLVALEVPYRVLCARIAVLMGLPHEDAERQLRRAQTLLGDDWLERAPMRMDIANARMQAPAQQAPTQQVAVGVAGCPPPDTGPGAAAVRPVVPATAAGR